MKSRQMNNYLKIDDTQVYADYIQMLKNKELRRIKELEMPLLSLQDIANKWSKIAGNPLTREGIKYIIARFKRKQKARQSDSSLNPVSGN